MLLQIRVRLVHALLLVAVLAAAWVPAPEARAQSDGPSLSLSPSSGPPPAASGSFSGNGWCPGGGVEVGGDAAGSGSIGRDGSLDGEFYVTGSAGQNRTVKVTAFCPDGDMSASARFRFDGGSSGGGSGPSPTRPAPSAPRPVTSSVPGSLTIPGCRSAPETIELEFVPMRWQKVMFGSNVLMRTGPALRTAARQGDAPGAYLFDLPAAVPGSVFEVRTRLWDRYCQTTSTRTSDLWVVGSGLSISYQPPWTTNLWGSTRISSPPVTGEINLGEWATLVSTSGSLADLKFVLKWETTYPGATAGVLQASALPFPTGSEADALAPDGLIASWPVTCANCVFSIDLTPVNPPLPPGSVTQGDITTAPSQIPFFNAATATPAPAGSPGAVVSIGSQAVLQEPFNPVTFLPPGGNLFPVTGFYFRILPVVGEAQVSPASNAVRMDWTAGGGGYLEVPNLNCLNDPSAPGCPTPTPTIKIESPYLIEIISYKTFNPPDNGHSGCYLVTKQTTITYPFDQKITYNVGDKFCQPKPEEKSWLEKAWSYATGALNWISQAYSDLKAEVVNLVAKFVPGELCGKQCLGTILDGALASMGIPPSIPNFDQLVNQGMDYLAQQAAMQVGIPEEVTKAANGSLLTGIALEEAKAQWQKTVEAKFKEGLQAGLLEAQKALSESVSYVPNGVPVKPDPDGEYQMPMLTLRISPNPKFSGTPVCTGKGTVSASARVEGPGLTGPVPMFWKLSKPLMTNTTYGLFDYRTFMVPALAAGETLEIPIVFAPYNDFVNFPYSEDRKHAWEELFKQGMATFFVSSSCGKTSLIWQPDQDYP